MLKHGKNQIKMSLLPAEQVRPKQQETVCYTMVFYDSSPPVTGSLPHLAATLLMIYSKNLKY